MKGEGIFTIGHSAHPVERFIELLRLNGVNAVGDVRSSPYSRFHPQYNREALKSTLREHGIAYVYLGEELGARSKDAGCYEDGKVRYERLAGTELFAQGLARVREGAAKYRLALMCAEKEPLECHRTILVARHVERLGLGVEHILEDGSVETHAHSLDRLVDLLHLPSGFLFGVREEVIEEAYRLQEERIAYEERALVQSAAG